MEVGAGRSEIENYPNDDLQEEIATSRRLDRLAAQCSMINAHILELVSKMGAFPKQGKSVKKEATLQKGGNPLKVNETKIHPLRSYSTYIKATKLSGYARLSECI